MNDLKHRKSKLWQAGALAFGSSILGAGLMLAMPSAASAQAAYGSYIGIGGSIGFTNGPGSSGTQGGGVIAARYKFLEAPVSIRAQALIGGSSAIVPTVSYDVPVDWNTDFYIGAGASIPLNTSTTNPSPVGNQAAFVLQPGVDYSFPNSNVMLFGNIIIAFDAYKDSNDTAASLQGGVGVRF